MVKKEAVCLLVSLVFVPILFIGCILARSSSGASLPALQNTSSIERQTSINLKYDKDTVYLKSIPNHVLTQSMISKENAIYNIEDYLDLSGSTIKIPNNCVLYFTKGCLMNGTVKGQNTIIKNDNSRRVFKGVDFIGSYLQEYINSAWFEYGDVNHLFDAIERLATSDIHTKIDIEKIRTTYTPVVRSYYLGEKMGHLFKIPSNTTIDFHGSELTVAPNDISFFNAIYIKDVINVEVKNLTLIGDIEGHTSTKYNEYSHGVYIYASQNVKIDSVTSSKFWGDGIGISGYADASKPLNDNVSVTNGKFIKNRRQGCSISKGANIMFENCDFLETGTLKMTPPSAGVDVEPNNGNDVLKNIVFKECKFIGNEGKFGGILIETSRLKYDLRAEEIQFINCSIDGIHQYGKGGGLFKSCYISNTKLRNNFLKASKNMKVEDCMIEFEKDKGNIDKLNNIKFIRNRFR